MMMMMMATVVGSSSDAGSSLGCKSSNLCCAATQPSFEHGNSVGNQVGMCLGAIGDTVSEEARFSITK